MVMIPVGQQGRLIRSVKYTETPTCSIPGRYFGQIGTVLAHDFEGGYSAIQFENGRRWCAWGDMLEPLEGPW